MNFDCGAWILDQPTTVSQQIEPAKTLVISGFTCQTVTAYSGYQQLSTHNLPVSLSPVIAHTPDGGKLIANFFGLRAIWFCCICLAVSFVIMFVKNEIT